MTRRRTRAINIGGVAVGGDAPISIQSMTNTNTADTACTVAQIEALAAAGCDIVRCAVPDEAAAAAIPAIVAQSPLPVVADIHFSHRLALQSIAGGVHALRINPGNIGGEDRVRAVIEAATERNIPLRIGINGGSLEKDLLIALGPTAEAMVASALRQIAICERYGFRDLKISLKSSSVRKTIEAYTLLAEKVDYPFHVGVTEAGTLFAGSIKSSLGIGILLYQGIGDTIRVSLTGDPVEEVRVAKEILRGLGLRREGIEIVSCPTCGRTRVNLIAMVEETERALARFTPKRPLIVAVMGCEVNGPGEAREADYGIAAGNGVGLLMRCGEVIGKYREEDIVARLCEEIRRNET